MYRVIYKQYFKKIRIYLLMVGVLTLVAGILFTQTELKVIALSIFGSPGADLAGFGFMAIGFIFILMSSIKKVR